MNLEVTSLSQIRQIENVIETITGTHRAAFYPTSLSTLSLSNENLTEVRLLIKQWLNLSGMNERAILNASPTVLANAYRVGKPYIDKVNADDRKGGFGKPRNHGPSRRGTPSLDIEIDFDDNTKELLTNVLDSPASTSEAIPHSTPSSTSNNPKIDEAAIARAAAQVIEPRLSQAKADLFAHVERQITDAANRFHISDASKAEIERIARTQGDYAALKAMDSYATKNDQIIAQLERMIPRRLEIRTPTFTKTLPAEHRHKVFDDVLTTLLCGEHVYLVGEAGTGKTHLFKQIGEALDQPTTVLGQTLTKYEFSGHLGPTGEYVTTLLRKAVEEGHLLAIDEIDASASAAIVFLNSLLANRFIAFPDRMVEAHPNFKLIAAANTYGFGATAQYIGRNPLDAASLDRFTYIECHYDEDLERSLYGDTPWTTYVHRVRAAVSRLELKHVVSMRAIDRGRKLLAQGVPADKVCSRALWRNLPPDAISRIESLAGTFTRKLEEAAD